MFQRISSLLFGAVEDVSAEVNGPKPCVTEADEEGWLLVSVPGQCLQNSVWLLTVGMWDFIHKISWHTGAEILTTFTDGGGVVTRAELQLENL